MEAVGKPFECPNEDCNLSFTNEDHLVVHKKKHELSLSLTPTTPFKTLFDQTPTPTRFINALDSADLFQDFNAENPFDATFRRANSGSGQACFVIPESSSLIESLPDTSEVLNTPSITLPTEPETPIIFKTAFSKLKFHKKDINPSPSENTDSLPFSPHEHPSFEKPTTIQCTTDSTAQLKKTVAPVTVNATNQANPRIITVSKSNVVQTPVITSVGNSTLLKTNANCVPTAVVTRQPESTTPAPSQPTIVTEKPSPVNIIQQPQTAVVQSVCVTPMLQLMIRLPDGQTMPVQLPVMSSTPAVTTVAQPPVQPAQPVPIAPEIPAANILTKMKLKEVLKLNKKTIINKKNHAINKLKTIEPVQPASSQEFNEFGLSPPPSPIAVPKPGHTGRKRRDAIDSVDEKRKRSLERNRAAATRCREKRKQWITALERKADELSVTNTQLQQEVTQLRNEVAHLKTLLLSHKDCPVTLQQKAIGYESEKAQEYTTIQIITTEDYQRVPSSSNVSPVQDTEYMEAEANSISSSDLSLTSDGSETSFNER